MNRGRNFRIVVAILAIALVAGLTTVSFQHNLWVGIGATVVSALIAYAVINRIPKNNED